MCVVCCDLNAVTCVITWTKIQLTSAGPSAAKMAPDLNSTLFSTKACASNMDFFENELHRKNHFFPSLHTGR